MEHHALEAKKAVRSAQAGVLQGPRLPRPGSQPDTVLQIVRAAFNEGVKDLTRREIGARWEAMDRAKGAASPRREAGMVSRCVKDLIDRQALQQLDASRNRVCKVTEEVASVVALISA